MKKILIDNRENILIRVVDERVMEVKFFDSFLDNIYRARVENKIPSIGSYFVKISEDENLFLKSTLDYKVGDNTIIQYVRKPANGKLGLASENFRIENEAYYVNRYPLIQKPKLKDGAEKNYDLYQDLLDKKERLIKEENFFPTPKLLMENPIKESYLEKYKDYKIEEIDINNSLIFSKLKESIKESKIAYKDLSIIIDELETLTVVDINTGSRKSKIKKEDFFLNINLELTDFLAYQLKLRNIGGMVLVDFLRSGNEDTIIENMKKAAEKYQLEAQIFGFTNMGLFEMTIKRRGSSLKDELRERNLLF